MIDFIVQVNKCFSDSFKGDHQLGFGLDSLLIIGLVPDFVPFVEVIHLIPEVTLRNVAVGFIRVTIVVVAIMMLVNSCVCDAYRLLDNAYRLLDNAYRLLDNAYRLVDNAYWLVEVVTVVAVVVTSVITVVVVMVSMSMSVSSMDDWLVDDWRMGSDWRRIDCNWVIVLVDVRIFTLIEYFTTVNGWDIEGVISCIRAIIELC